MIQKFTLFCVFIVMAYAQFWSEPSKGSADAELCSKNGMMPLVNLRNKEYYFGIFFKANWFQAFQFCRYHGLHLAVILTEEENDSIVRYINETGHYKESFWLSGTDLQEEGKFVWMSTGAPVFYADWHIGNPDNSRHPDGQNEHCLHLWNSANILKWNDARCSDAIFFICQVL